MKLSILTHNLGMKVIALVLSLGLWVFVAASINNVAKFPGSIPVKIVNLNPNLTAIYDTKEVTINVSADANNWRQLSSDDFTAFLDLNGLSTGTYNLKVTVSSNQSGVQVISVDPEEIMVRIETIEKKSVPVVAVISGQAADGQMVGGVDFSPEEVEISGPKSVIQMIDSVSAKIELNGESDNFSRTVLLKALNESGEVINNVEIAPTEVKSDVQITRSGNNKTVGVKVLTSGSPQSGYYINSIIAEPSVVDIIGQDSVLRQTQYLETAAIDVTNISETLIKTVNLSIPSGISLQGNVSPRVKVTINLSANQSSKEVIVALNPINLASGFKVDGYSPATVKAIVTGPISKLNSINSSDVVLNLDLTGKTAGSNGIEISRNMFKLTDGLSLSSFLPSAISVNISTN